MIVLHCKYINYIHENVHYGTSIKLLFYYISYRRQNSIKVDLKRSSQVQERSDNESDAEEDKEHNQEQNDAYFPHSIPTG